MNEKPSTADESGRDLASGRFRPGNRFSMGNNHNRKTAAWRKAFALSVSARQLRAIVAVLLRAALSGEAWAIREVLNRCLGSPVPVDVLAEIEELRNVVERITDDA